MINVRVTRILGSGKRLASQMKDRRRDCFQIGRSGPPPLLGQLFDPFCLSIESFPFFTRQVPKDILSQLNKEFAGFPICIFVGPAVAGDQSFY